MTRVRTGLEALLARPGAVRGLKLGLICNAASVTGDLVHAALALGSARAFRLKALFGPEHGIWGDAQDLVELEDGRDPATGLPVHSLYGRTRIPSAEMLAGLDALLFDLQDVGARFYTFIYTMLYALEACARHGRRLVVLDRPNPLGGAIVDGNVLDPRFRSFVGLHPLAVRHGMTVGELALLFRHELGLRVDLRVVRMRGWRRAMEFEATGLPWVQPSPNMPSVGHGLRLPGRLPGGRHEPVRGPRHHASLRAGRRALARRLGAGARPRARAHPGRRCSVPPSSRPRSRSTRAAPARACRSTSPTAGAFRPSWPTCS